MAFIYEKKLALGKWTQNSTRASSEALEAETPIALRGHWQGKTCSVILKSVPSDTNAHKTYRANLGSISNDCVQAFRDCVEKKKTALFVFEGDKALLVKPSASSRRAAAERAEFMASVDEKYPLTDEILFGNN